MSEHKDIPISLESADEPAAEIILEETIKTIDSYVRRNYISELQNAQVVPIRAAFLDLGIGRNVRLFKLMSFSYSADEEIYEKMASIYKALSGFHSNQILILDSDGFEVSLYFGIAGDKAENLSIWFETFKGSFCGNFPGGRIAALNASKCKSLLDSIFDEPDINISSVSVLASEDKKTENAGFKIEQMVNGMHGKPFTMILIAESVPHSELSLLRQSFEAMYTQLSPYQMYSFSVSDGITRSFTESYNITRSESVTEGSSVTESNTFGKSKSTSHAVQQQEEEKEKNARNQMIGTAVSLAAIMAGVGAGQVNGALQAMQGLFYGANISNILGSAQILANGAGNSATDTNGESENVSFGFSSAETHSIQKGFSASKGMADASGRNDSRSLQLSYKNMSVINLLKILEQQIDRIQRMEEQGGLNCAAYFITGDYATALMAANLYRSLLKGSSSGQSNAVNVWSDPYKIEDLSEYLRYLQHPIFHFESKENYPRFSVASLVSVDEIPLYVSLPHNSMTGLPVAVHAEFTRESAGDCENLEDKIEIGSVFHMGKPEQGKVCLSKNALRGHMLVAGTTGMGKSNFCYGLLSELHKKKVNFMVIEPAKGEYQRVFGGMSDVWSYGTNPNLAEMLRINPFSFPDDVHVTEHIDRLLEIFNSCWPMYAAMPAVLKESMELIYKNCGYNLLTGKNRRRNIFPTFSDLLKALREVINRSEFSGEVKGNYIGSLVTRVSSLTDGLYGHIFAEDEIKGEELFDRNVLIDLSRVGSGETKALIMGILVMKLQEYRMTGAQMNAPLQHITVLEEAHHLLRASVPSSSEGVNVRAMSVEMVTNAIAEMRTYGESFVIADQSPALLDSSVIRNTNTKVVFKLPELSDRQTAGNAMSLTQEQIMEFSRLECGVAAVYQSNWDNAVLAKIRYYNPDNFKPLSKKPVILKTDSRLIQSQCLALVLKERLNGRQVSSCSQSKCDEIITNSKYADNEDQEYIKMIVSCSEEKGYHPEFAVICQYVDRILDSRKLLKNCGSFSNIKRWLDAAGQYVECMVDLTEDEINEAVLLCINMRIRDDEAIRKLYFRVYAILKGQK